MPCFNFRLQRKTRSYGTIWIRFWRTKRHFPRYGTEQPGSSEAIFARWVQFYYHGMNNMRNNTVIQHPHTGQRTGKMYRQQKITCQVSPVMCRKSPVTCHMSLTTTITGTDLPTANSPIMHSSMVRKDQQNNLSQLGNSRPFLIKNLKFWDHF